MRGRPAATSQSSLPSVEQCSWLPAAHWTGWARVCSLIPRSPGNQAQLQDPTSSEGQDDDRPQNHGEQQCYGQRQGTIEGQEGHPAALPGLPDEEEGATPPCAPEAARE